MMRWLPVLLFALLLAVFLWRLEAPSERQHSNPLVGKPLPAFSLPLLGQEGALSVEDIEGAYLLNVFASWCLVCVAEHPVLTTIAQDIGVPVYGLNWKDAPEDATGWLARHGNIYMAIWQDISGDTGLELGVSGAPETFLISGEGQVLYHIAGPMTPEVWQQQFAPLLVEERP